MSSSFRNIARLVMRNGGSDTGSISLSERELRFAEPSPGAPGAAAPGWLWLLDRFYQRANLPAPKILPIRGSEMPKPYHSLLVHSSDMTPTLEAYYGQPMGLVVLSRELQDNAYLREVILRRTVDGAAVEYGVIRICLGHLPPPAARRVLEEHSPLGNILQTESVPHLSWPQAFFRVESDAHMQSMLRLDRAGELYGRRNVLVDSSRKLLAEVIEILAPVRESELRVHGHERPGLIRNPKPETNPNGQVRMQTPERGGPQS